ncbi:cytochrome P450 [Mycena metata]|uniref:Cytochrome P450 n=1 Tax=Mycena metata TaxID=1033252 RepID=A0AAD7NJI3_9AGAR|nr:cytochrome P450 [Mycena metata]
MILQVLVPIVGTLLFYILYHAGQVLYHNLTSPLRHVVGPKSPSLLVGNFKEMAEKGPRLTKQWRDEFGSTFTFKGLFNVSELHTSDVKAVAHIVQNSALYQKSPATLVLSQRLLGKGLLSVERDEHKRHASFLSTPAFGVTQIRLLTEVFVEKSVQPRDIWSQQVEKEDGARIDVLSWLRKMTLDVIGQAGFNYQFHGLEPDHEPDALNTVFTELFHSPQSIRNTRFRVAQSMVPILRLLPVPGWRTAAEAYRKMTATGSQLVSESKARMNTAEGEKTVGSGRDLLSLIVKANLSTNLPESQRLNEAEVIAPSKLGILMRHIIEIPTFFLAGHETTSTAASWALHALSHDQRVQTKLREELLTISTDNPTMDDLNSLPYLESVVREVMRVHAPAVFTQRMAMQDDVLPLSKPYIDRDGKAHDSLLIPKGQMMHIPILAVNTDPEIWGQDAHEFRPERWEKIPERASAIPGVWANLMTFFAGPHTVSALLFTLIRAFKFEPGVPRDQIGPIMGGILQRPSVIGGDSKQGSGLPLIVTAYNPQL